MKRVRVIARLSRLHTAIGMIAFGGILGRRWNRGRSPSAAVCALVLALSACTTLGKAPDATAVASYERSWAELELSEAQRSTKEGYHHQVSLIHSALFRTLPTTEQHDRLLAAARLAYVYHDDSTGYEFARRSSEMPGADVLDWALRVATAYKLGDHLDAMRALTRVARRWPIELRRFYPPAVREMAQYRPKSPAENEARIDLLQALYSAYWVDEDGVPPYGLWGELAAELFEKGRVDQALAIARQVDSPRFVLWMRVDKRFDALVKKDPDAFDIDRAGAQEVAVWIDAANRYPRRLDPIVKLTNALLDVGRYEDVLKITGGVLARVRDAADFKRVFNDDETGLNWILDNHAAALAAQQDWKDAEWDRRAAADRLEHGRRNVSNVINLAAFEVNLGRWEETLKVLAELPEGPARLSPYGQMLAYDVRLEAAAEEGDAALEARCLTYMQMHQEDALAIYEDALVEADRTDEAAKLLIRRLKDPQTRREALLEAQHYRNPPGPPEMQRERKRWREIVERKDVQKALARVGRVLDVALPG